MTRRLTASRIALGLAGAAVLASLAVAQPTVVRGTDDVFAAGLPAARIPAGMGSAPHSILVHPGEKLLIEAHGQAYCCGPSGPKTGPDGFETNPFGQGAHIANPLNTRVGGFDDPKGAFALAGVFTGGGQTRPVIKLGAHSVVIVPAGATRLYLGMADANGFSGQAGTYDDNGGQFTVRVSEMK